LQFTPQFTFGDAAELLLSLHALGISDFCETERVGNYAPKKE